MSHYYTTGPEIWEATDHKVTHFVAGIGTGGTISGTGKYLKEVSDGAVTVVGSDPAGSIYSDPNDVHQYDIEGVGEDFYPKAFDRNITDDIVQVTDREAFEMTRRLASEEGLLVGGSSGMAVVSALKYAREHDLDSNQVVVVLLPDSGRSYLEKIFNDDGCARTAMATSSSGPPGHHLPNSTCKARPSPPEPRPRTRTSISQYRINTTNCNIRKQPS